MTELEVGWKVKREGNKHSIYDVMEVATHNDVQVAIIREESRYRSIVHQPLTALVSTLTRVCAKLVSEGGRSVSVHTCGRPSKTDDGLCGLHASVIKRNADREQKRRDDQADARVKMDQARAELEALGVDGYLVTHFDSRFVPTWGGRVSLTMDEVRRLAGG